MESGSFWKVHVASLYENNTKINIYGCVSWQNISQHALRYTFMKMKNDSILCMYTTQWQQQQQQKHTYINIWNTQRVKIQKLLTLWVEVTPTINPQLKTSISWGMYDLLLPPNMESFKRMDLKVFNNILIVKKLLKSNNKTVLTVWLQTNEWGKGLILNS